MKAANYYQFGDGATYDNVGADLVGGKAAGLMDMAKIHGIAIPEGFVLPVHYCLEYQEATDKAQYMQNLMEQVVGPAWNKMFANKRVMLSVRSGARVSMPGMMDTILNVGLTAGNMPAWKQLLGERAALDCMRRLMEMYGQTVLGIEAKKFKYHLGLVKKYKHGLSKPPEADSEMNVEHLVRVIERYNILYSKEKATFPLGEGEKQLKDSIEAVFKSWNSDRAKIYRKLNKIPDEWGTAVIVQEMIFGNKGEDSCSGVLFTRNPNTGVNEFMGEFLVNAQGEDVVAGTAKPTPLDEMKEWDVDTFNILAKTAVKLEEHYLDMQDIEFTVENGKLYILQTRSGKRSAEAAFRIAYEMREQYKLTTKHMLSMVSAKQYKELNSTQIDPAFEGQPIAQGAPASGGLVSGKPAFTSADAVQIAKSGGNAILVRRETSPDDIEGMAASVGIITQVGGLTSHAAVVARSMNKACVVGCPDIVSICKKVALMDMDTAVGPAGVAIGEITIDGSTGKVWLGVVPVTTAAGSEWAEMVLKVGMDGKDFIPIVLVDPQYTGLNDESSKRVVFDTSGLDMPELGATREHMAAFLEILKGMDIEEAFIHLKAAEPEKEVVDMVLWDAFGKEEKVQQQSGSAQAAAKIGAFVTGGAFDDLKDKVHIILPDATTDAAQTLIKNAGWNITPTIKTVADLLQANQYAVITKEFRKVCGTETKLKELMEVFKKAGREIKQLPEGTYKDKLIFDILG